MLKRVLCVLLFLLFTFGTLCVAPVSNVSAESIVEQREELEDGDYIIYVTRDSVFNDENSGSYGGAVEESVVSSPLSLLSRIIKMMRTIVNFLTGTKTVEKAKSVNYYDKNGKLLWTVTLHAKFSYTKKKVTCEGAYITAHMLDDDWKLVLADASKGVATATGHFAVRQSKLGVNLKTIEKTIRLTCDTTGNVT